MALMATTGVTPCRRTMARWASRLAAPSWTSSGFSSSMAGGSGRPGHDAVPPRVQLHRPDRRHHDRGIGHEARRPALDVEEALGAHVGAEPGLGDQELPGVDPDQVGHHRRVAVGDVAEGPGVDQRGRVLERLQQVGLDGVAHDHGHGAGGLELLRGDRVTGRGVAHDDASHALTQVAQRRGEREHRHHLGGRGDVEAGLPRRAVLLRPESAHDVPEGAVVDVEHALPRDVVRIEPMRVAVVDVVVHHGGQQVVGRRHGVQVARQVQVQALERDHLAVAAAGGAALDPEGRSHGGLPDGDGRLPTDAGPGPARARPSWWSCPRRAASGSRRSRRRSGPAAGRPGPRRRRG